MMLHASRARYFLGITSSHNGNAAPHATPNMAVKEGLAPDLETSVSHQRKPHKLTQRTTRRDQTMAASKAPAVYGARKPRVVSVVRVPVAGASNRRPQAMMKLAAHDAATNSTLERSGDQELHDLVGAAI